MCVTNADHRMFSWVIFGDVSEVSDIQGDKRLPDNLKYPCGAGKASKWRSSRGPLHMNFALLVAPLRVGLCRALNSEGW